ncbi:MAG: hypothetical protein SVV80_10555, partial [Planctomycetota bacterium]|nr:hypothetical protein [Planctomycetota bacterium]
FVGDWTYFHDGKVELTFEYKNASQQMRKPNTYISYISVSLVLDYDVAGSLVFYNDGNLQPAVQIMTPDQTTEAIRLGKAADLKDLSRKSLATARAAQAADVHSAKISWDNGRISISTDEIKKIFKQKNNKKYSRAALVITSFYPEYGPAPKVLLRNIKLNGRRIKLYTDNWNPDRLNVNAE